MSKVFDDRSVRRARHLLVLGLAATFFLSGLPLDKGEWGFHPAHAQDDGGGDDGGDDGDGGDGDDGGGDDGGARSGGGGFRGFFGDDDDNRRAARPRQRQRTQQRPRRQQTVRAAPVALPSRAANEIVASGLTPAQLRTLAGQGYGVIEQATLEAGATEIVRLRVPRGTTIETARQAVRDLAPAAEADFNHYYRPGQVEAAAAAEAGTALDATACSGLHCAAISLIGWPAGGSPGSCRATPAAIGLIDTAINPDHAVFADGQVEVIRVSDDALPRSDRQHGTAVAALLVGSAGSPTPGLLPGAKLIAVDAFHRGERSDDRADAFALSRAIDTLASRRVNVVNMSLSGPDNVLLAGMVRRATATGIVIVAAAGNAGPRAAPVFPAAYPEVIAVTAIDQQKRAYRRAARGDHIDLSAPGVGIWTAASISGARPKTGTSFAAPFVTAMVALAHTPDMPPALLQERLGSTAEDLGDKGRDAVFGWGLVNARGFCAGAH